MAIVQPQQTAWIEKKIPVFGSCRYKKCRCQIHSFISRSA